MKRMRIHVALGAALVIGSIPVHAEEQAGVALAPIARAIADVSAGSRWSTAPGLVLAGLTIPAGARQPGGTTASSRRDGWIGRHPVVFGTLIGAGTGLVVESQACGLQSCYGFISAAIAGVGAYGGLAASAVRKANRKEPISGRTKAGLISGAIVIALGSWAACYGMGGCGGFS